MVVARRRSIWTIFSPVEYTKRTNFPFVETWIIVVNQVRFGFVLISYTSVGNEEFHSRVEFVCYDHRSFLCWSLSVYVHCEFEHIPLSLSAILVLLLSAASPCPSRLDRCLCRWTMSFPCSYAFPPLVFLVPSRWVLNWANTDSIFVETHDSVFIGFYRREYRFVRKKERMIMEWQQMSDHDKNAEAKAEDKAWYPLVG